MSTGISQTPIETRQARYCVLSAEFPGEDVIPIGVLLEDPWSGDLSTRFRRDWEVLFPDEQVEFLESVENDLHGKAREMGTPGLLAWLTGNLSNFLLISDPQTALAGGRITATLDRVYKQHIRSTVLPYQTHLPQYSLRSAAGRFLENEEVECEEWIEAPNGIRLSQGMFAAHIQGTSMEPVIPDGSVAVFRAGVTGTRQGKRVLVEETTQTGSAYTLKIYKSVKRPHGEDSTVRESIRLEPINPEHGVIELDPDEDRYRIVAEFVEVAGSAE